MIDFPFSLCYNGYITEKKRRERNNYPCVVDERPRVGLQDGKAVLDELLLYQDKIPRYGRLEEQLTLLHHRRRTIDNLADLKERQVISK